MKTSLKSSFVRQLKIIGLMFGVSILCVISGWLVYNFFYLIFGLALAGLVVVVLYNICKWAIDGFIGWED